MGRPRKTESINANEATIVLSESTEAKKVGRKKQVAVDDNDDDMADKWRVIGANIRRERRIRDFSIESLAECLDLSPSYVGLLERGQRCPSMKIVYRLCDLFGVSTNSILSLHADPYNRLSVAESPKSAYINKQKTATSLISKIPENELDFVITVIKNMKLISKKDAE